MQNNILSENALFFNENNCVEFLQKLLFYADSNFENLIHLNGNNIPYLYDSFPNVVAFGGNHILNCNSHQQAFEKLKTFSENQKRSIFGFLGYNLKNDIENLSSKNNNPISFPDLFFFEPEYIFLFENNGFWVDTNDKNTNILIEKIKDLAIQNRIKNHSKIIYQITENEYFEKLNLLKSKIIRGDIYEVNFCINHIIETAIEPVHFYQSLCEHSPMPFSSFVKHDSKYIICASPERFLKKRDNLLISQPIKGTAKRGKNTEEDQLIINELQHSEKELAENIMIVDLVRNDLSHTAKDGSVEVKELCKVYTFERVHQMISTITAIKSKNFHFVDSIKHCFPMGSMTGAPKVRAMQLIDEIETYDRGIFSGSIGYITPQGNFDFNVIIRSLVYDKTQKMASFHVGSAITIDSDNAKEFQECEIKSAAVRDILEI